MPLAWHFSASSLGWTDLKDQCFAASRLEGHPCELAHSLIAEALFGRLVERLYADA